MPFAKTLRRIIFYPIIFISYQLFWLLSASFFYKIIYEPGSDILRNFLQIINPGAFLIYSMAFYPLTILCFFTVLLYNYSLKYLSKKSKISIINKSLLFISVATIAFFVGLLILRLIDTKNKDYISLYTFPLNGYERVGLFGYVFGTILIAFVILPIYNIIKEKSLS